MIMLGRCAFCWFQEAECDSLTFAATVNNLNMGFILTLVYIGVSYLAPATIFGSLAQFHIELLIAIAATLFSLLSVPRSPLFQAPQTLALVGLSAAVFMSLVATGWIGGAPRALLDFLPNAFAYFLVLVNCRTKRHLQALTIVLLFVSIFVISHGFFDLRHGKFDSTYLMTQNDETGVPFYRIRGAASIADPNDFSQLLVSLIPLLFIFWHKKQFFRNLVLVIVPASVLIFGMFLSHSRGGIVALLAVIVIAGWKRLGPVTSAITACVMFAAITALNWSGGRSISADAGADRMEAWAAGLQLLRANPIFGVGYHRFTEYFYITAHNSVVVCAAELGMFGLFFWVFLVLSSLHSAYAVVSTTREPELPVPDAYSNLPQRKPEELTREQINQFGRLIILSLIGFLVAGWFLSRAYVMILFVYVALAEVVLQLAIERGMVSKRISLGRLLPIAGAIAVFLVSFVHAILRINNLFR